MSVPALRFSEFTENWRLDNLLSLSENGFTNGIFNDPAKVGSGYKLVNVLDMFIETTIDEAKLKLVELDEAEFIKNKVEHGDVFFTRSSLVKEGIAYSNTYLGKSEDITFDGHLIRMRPKKDLLNSSFLNYLLKTSSPRSQLVKRGKTATMTTIGQADIAEVVIKFPSKLEQTKIANFLTAVDEKISQLTQKHALLSQYKKGVMQQIFSHSQARSDGTETYPRGISQTLRFKDDNGQDFPEWEEKMLGELFNITSSKRVFQNEWTKSGVPFYRAREVVKLSEKGFVENELYISTEMYNEYKTKYGVPQKNDLLVTGVGTIGRLYVVKDGERFYFKDGNIIWFKTLNLVNSQFVSQLFQSLIIKKQIEDNASITTVGTYTIDSAKKTVIPFPSVDEQTKIANFLTAIDDKITATQTQLQAVKLYKQGLLQQMFV